MRSVFLPPEAAAFEVTGSFELAKCAAVLLAWTIGGLILSLLFFRWNKRGQD
jgi:ABC-2 type transport system permease protein